MALASVIATTVTTPDLTRSFTVNIGGRDCTADALWSEFLIEQGNGEAQGRASILLTRNLGDIPEVRNQALVEVTDHRDSGSLAFRGFVDGRRRGRAPLWGTVKIEANDHSSLLSNIVANTYRPAESDVKRIGYLWGRYATNALSGDLSYVNAVNASLPAAYYDGLTLAETLDLVAAQAAAAAWWYLDTAGRLHYGTSESIPAPKNVTSDTPAGDYIAPLDLDVDDDSTNYVQAVFVRGRNQTGSGWIYSQAAVANHNGLIRTAYLDAPDVTTFAMKNAVAQAFLQQAAAAIQRGSFSVTSADADGWRAGQSVIVDSTHLGIVTTQYRVVRVRTEVLGPYAGYTAGLRRYTVEFNRGKRARPF